MYIGYINGLFKKRFYPDDIKLPMILIGSSDIVNNLMIYIVMFFMRSRFSFCLTTIRMLPPSSFGAIP